MQREIDMTAHIPCGYENGLTRVELRIRTGLSDRAMRQAIEWTSEHIETVYSYGGKYFLYGGHEDDYYCEAYYLKERARCLTQNRKVRRMRPMWGKEKKADGIPGQMSLELGGVGC